MIVHIMTYERSDLVNSEKYIGLDVHQATISVAVMDPMGKVVMESILETKAATILEFFAGQVRRRKKQVSIRGLNKDHNHDLKGLFKAAATRASVQPGPFQDFYQRSLAKGIKPTMVRLTLARKIAAITLTLWKKGETFDAEKLKAQAA